MKRALIQNVKVLPYTSGDAIDREGYLSAIVAASSTAGGNVSIEITHADAADGEFAAVPDTEIIVGGKSEVTLEAGGIANIDVDLVGCKQFVKFTVTGGDACALALGDPAEMPV